MIKNIQYLRFVAALLVVIAHANLQIFGVPAGITNIAGVGVDLFFVISGFIMPFILFGGLYKPGSLATNTASAFMLRRLARIWPMYFLATVASMVLSGMVAFRLFGEPNIDLSYAFNSSRLSLKWLFESMTFTHWARPPLLGVGWSLQVEFFFYTAIAFGLFFGAKKLESLEFGVLGFFFLLMLLASVTTTNSLIAQDFSNPLIVEFLFGLFLYRAVSNGILMKKSLAISTIFLFIPLVLLVTLNDVIQISIPNLDRSIQWGVPALLLVWAAISLEGTVKEIKLMSLLGDASYSTYLVHALVGPLYIFYTVKFNIATTIGPYVYLAGMLLLCHAAGIAAHIFVEKPINNIVKNFTFMRKTLTAS
ncbi:acyltransferase [Pseudomonas fluorescens]|uniref:acyltransferase family protein n=1 Tax=Pseudomonas fluorescens TaxID=294 RepID=UPI003525A6EE